jgi:predicted ATPase/DNA-binding winged helix-turn-helix (wHTH) protein
MLASSTPTLDRGRVQLDLRARVLNVAGQPAKLGSRAFDLLVALIERRDRVVSKQELLDVVWPGLVVEENNLQVQVVTLRKLLGPQAIVTVSGRGYRCALQPDAEVPAPAASAGSPVATFAPTAPDGLIGRGPLLAMARAQLAAPGTRLLTLTGAGGSGKTRLALHVAAERSAALADGAYVVMLAPVREATHVVGAIAAAVGVQDGGRELLVETLAAFLRPRAVLLLLDNLEHLPDAAAQVVDLLHRCPRLQVLATSRSRLRLAEEQVLEVPPLALPSDEQPGTWRDSPAVALFAQRAATLGRDVLASPEDLAAAVQICRRLDGLPLAIELAAARLRVLTPRALASRLQQALPLLKGQAADAPARHQTLRDTIGWSHDLLDAAAQRLFRRLAVFVGGWSLEAAEALGDDPAVVLDQLEALMDHHLVQRIDDVDDAPRYTMLETIREFGLEQLVRHGELDALRERHAGHLAELALRQDRRLRSAERPRARGVLAAERANLRAALAWAGARPDAELACRLAGRLGWWWYFDDALREGEAVLTPLLPCSAPAALRAPVWASAARLALYLADTDGALTRARTAIALAQSCGDRETLAMALNIEAVAVSATSRDEGVACMQRCAEAFRALNDAWGVAFAVSYIGVILAFRPGREVDAEAYLQEGRVRFEALGDVWGTTTPTHYLGLILARRGDLAGARHWAERSLQGSLAEGDNFRAVGSHHQLARLAVAAGDLDTARRHQRQCIELRLERGHQVDAWRHGRWLARLHWLQGRREAALRWFAASDVAGSELLRSVGTTVGAVDAQEFEAAWAELQRAWPGAETEPAWRESQALSVPQLLAITDADTEPSTT